MADGPALELTLEEIKNGWTPETLAIYRRERDQAVGFKDDLGLTAGNVVTSFTRPRALPRIEPAARFRPHAYRQG